MGCSAPGKGWGQGCEEEGTRLSRSGGTALFRESCLWSLWHSLPVFSRTPQAFPSFVAWLFLPHPLLSLRSIEISCNWGMSMVWNYLPAGRKRWDVLVSFCALGCTYCSGSAGEGGLAPGSPSSWPAASHASFPFPPPPSPSCLFSCLFPCSFDSLLLGTLLHIN